MKGAGDGMLEDEGDIGVCGLNLSGADESAELSLGKGVVRFLYFANSSMASVVLVVFSFLTSRMFRGGDGHCRDSRSCPFVSMDISAYT